MKEKKIEKFQSFAFSKNFEFSNIFKFYFFNYQILNFLILLTTPSQKKKSLHFQIFQLLNIPHGSVA